MHVITRSRLIQASKEYPDCSGALDQWYRLIQKSDPTDFASLRRLFNSVDKVKDLYVFNIGGNKLRLITAIHFNRQKVFIRHVLTHSEYDLGKWKS